MDTHTYCREPDRNKFKVYIDSRATAAQAMTLQTFMKVSLYALLHLGWCPKKGISCLKSCSSCCSHVPLVAGSTTVTLDISGARRQCHIAYRCHQAPRMLLVICG